MVCGILSQEFIKSILIFRISLRALAHSNFYYRDAGIYSFSSMDSLAGDFMDHSLERDSALESGQKQRQSLVHYSFGFQYLGDFGNYLYFYFFKEEKRVFKSRNGKHAVE